MKIEHTEVYGFRAAFRGMRNPFDSWDNSDSEYWGGHNLMLSKEILVPEKPKIGPNDLALAKKLINKGGDHRKFLRMIAVWCDFVFPRCLWQEMDTYKVATVRNSCSTMNTLGLRDLTNDDFERPLPEIMLQELNKAVQDFRESKGNPEKDTPELRIAMKNLVPEGFLQRATFMANYEVYYRVFWSRKNHRLPFWNLKHSQSICSWIIRLPYMEQFLYSGAK